MQHIPKFMQHVVEYFFFGWSGWILELYLYIFHALYGFRLLLKAQYSGEQLYECGDNGGCRSLQEFIVIRHSKLERRSSRSLDFSCNGICINIYIISISFFFFLVKHLDIFLKNYYDKNRNMYIIFLKIGSHIKYKFHKIDLHIFRQF